MSLSSLNIFDFFTFEHFRTRDAVDVVIVAILVYGLLLVLRKRKLILFCLSVFFLVSLYYVAQYFHLYVTTLLMKGFFAIFAVLMIILFQDEFRHSMEHLLLPPRSSKKSLDTRLKALSDLSEVAFDLAKERVGALFVVRGLDSLERYLSGGYELQGKFSEALAKSIFDPHSIGHDGALVLNEKGTVERFACQLPLTQDNDKIERRGTRHSAAVGLTERCDAVCIVVSEERGQVSIAEHGMLKAIENVSELNRRLGLFLDDRFGPQISSAWYGWLIRNLHLKLVALLLAFGFWALLAQKVNIVEKDFSIPIEYRNLPSHLVISEPRPEQVKMTLKGQEKSFLLFDSSSFKLTLDLGKTGTGKKTFVLTDKDFNLPLGVSITSIEPANLDLKIDEFKPVALPVEAQLAGQLDSNLHINRITITPKEMMVLIASDRKTRDLKILTDPIPLDKIKGSQTFKLKALLPPGILPMEGTAPEFQVDIEISTVSETQISK